MVGIPFNDAILVQLAQLTVGVAVSEPGARDAGGFGFSASGSRSLDNNFLLDGIDNNSYRPVETRKATYVVMPPPDALQEFKIETGNYDAESRWGHRRHRKCDHQERVQSISWCVV